MQACSRFQAEIDTQYSLLHTSYHHISGEENFSISVITALGEVMNLDPMEVPFFLDDHVDGDLLDRLPTLEANACLHFSFGGYEVYCSSVGTISIFGDMEDQENGDVSLPPSMHDNLQLERVPANREYQTGKLQPESDNL